MDEPIAEITDDEPTRVHERAMFRTHGHLRRYLEQRERDARAREQRWRASLEYKERNAS